MREYDDVPIRVLSTEKGQKAEMIGRYKGERNSFVFTHHGRMIESVDVAEIAATDTVFYEEIEQVFTPLVAPYGRKMQECIDREIAVLGLDL